MRSAVDTDVYKLIFDRQGRNFMTIELHASLAREELFDREPAGKVAQREIVMQFNEQPTVGPREKILSRNLSGVDRG